MERTHNWAKICVESHTRPEDQALFLIVQGAIYEDLRKQSVEALTKYDVPGFAIGGASVGESREDIDRIVKYTAPSNKPRYLMGIGTTEDIVKAIAAGVDMFDCVMPTESLGMVVTLLQMAVKQIKMLLILKILTNRS